MLYCHRTNSIKALILTYICSCSMQCIHCFPDVGVHCSFNTSSKNCAGPRHCWPRPLCPPWVILSMRTYRGAVLTTAEKDRADRWMDGRTGQTVTRHSIIRWWRTDHLECHDVQANSSKDSFARASVHAGLWTVSARLHLGVVRRTRVRFQKPANHTIHSHLTNYTVANLSATSSKSNSSNNPGHSINHCAS